MQEECTNEALDDKVELSMVSEEDTNEPGHSPRNKVDDAVEETAEDCSTASEDEAPVS